MHFCWQVIPKYTSYDWKGITTALTICTHLQECRYQTLEVHRAKKLCTILIVFGLRLQYAGIESPRRRWRDIEKTSSFLSLSSKSINYLCCKTLKYQNMNSIYNEIRRGVLNSLLQGRLNEHAIKKAALWKIIEFKIIIPDFFTPYWLFRIGLKVSFMSTSRSLHA